MRKVVLYIAMSLDGYIADKSGGVGWILGDGSAEESLGSYEEFITTVDTVILGYNTYHQITTELSPKKWVYEGMQSYVFTRKFYKNKTGITFIDDDFESFIMNLKKQSGKKIWICGGASIINQLIALDLIDEYYVTIIPTILGSGIKLFGDLKNEIKLKLELTRHYNGMVDLSYIRR